jgi:hypothetical protein
MLSHDNSSSGVAAKGQKLMPEILPLHAKALFDYASTCKRATARDFPGSLAYRFNAAPISSTDQGGGKRRRAPIVLGLLA